MAPSLISAPSQSETSASKGLTDEQLTFWDSNGYLLIEDALDPTTVSSLLAESHTLLEGFSLDDHPLTQFSTGEDGREHVGDDYFLTSGDKIRFFFEQDAFDSNGKLARPKHRAVNKIGHYLHELSPSFRIASLSRRNAVIARSLGFRDPRVLQSMIICKQPEIGGRVPPHQDSTFLYTNPPSAVGFWYALEDATIKNGCLSFARGSHKRSPVKQRFVRKHDGAGTEFVDVTTSRFPKGISSPGADVARAGNPSEHMGHGGSEDGDSGSDSEEAEEEYKIGEVKAGTLVLIHGNLLHKSEKNTSGKSRFIYTFHMIEGENDYDDRNWLQPPSRGFSKLPLVV